MYNDYIQKGNNVSYESFRKVFESENIGFGETSTDECDVCLKFNAHVKSVSSSSHDQETCETCSTSLKHLEKAKSAREHYRNDMERSNVYSADMQKILLLPKLTTKEHIF